MEGKGKEDSIQHTIARVAFLSKDNYPFKSHFCNKILPVQGKKLPVQGKKLPVQGKKLPVQGKKLPVQGKKLPVQMR